VVMIKQMNNIRYNFLFACLLETFGVSTKSILLEAQMAIIPKINATLIKFMRYSALMYLPVIDSKRSSNTAPCAAENINPQIIMLAKNRNR
jgi:hypothetical protein